MKNLFLSLVALFLITLTTNAQNPGDIDTSFGINGFTITDPYANTDEIYWDLITLADNKIIKVGYSDDGGDADILIGKFLTDGTPDKNFGTDGFTKIDLSNGESEHARSVAELPNGKLLVTGLMQDNGDVDGFIMRLNANGTLDNSFGTSTGHTKFNTGDNSAAYGQEVIISGSEIFVGGAAKVNGKYDIIVVNFTMGGGIDNSFSSSGFATMDINGEDDHLQAMDVKSNGAFVFGGTAENGGDVLGLVGSLTQFGTPTSFGTGGSYTFDMGSGSNEVNDLFVDDNNNVVFTGNEGTGSNINGFVQRLKPTGVLDNSFANGGIQISDPGNTTALFFKGVAEMPNGDIIAVGNFDEASHDIYSMLLTSAGKLVSDYGGNGDVITPFSVSKITGVQTAGCALQDDGSIIIGGSFASENFDDANMFMVRLHPNSANTGIFDVQREMVNVYPNPTSGIFKIDFDHIQNVQLISMQGQKLTQWGRQDHYQIPQGIAAGVYILQIESDDAVGVARLTVR